MLAANALAIGIAGADVIAFTSFDGKEIDPGNGATATNLNWTLNGVEDPGDMRVVRVEGDGSDGPAINLFDGNDFVRNIFAPGINTGNGNTSWRTAVSLTPTPGTKLVVTDVTLDYWPVSGAQVENVNRRSDFTASLFDPSGTLLTEVTVPDVLAGTGIGSPAEVVLTFDGPVELTGSGPYLLKIRGGDFTEINETGNHTAIDNLSINGMAAADSPFRLWIRPNAATDGNFDFEWDSRDGKVYDLVSATELSAAPESWPVWRNQADLAATPPTNTLVDIAGGGDPNRFFAVVEKEAPPPPPLLSEDFEGNTAIPNGWSADDNGAATIWEAGDPSAGPAEGPDAAAGGTRCAGTNITAKYTPSAVATLTSPAIAVPAGGATLSFQQYIDTDTTGDVGAVRLLDADNADSEISGGGFPVTPIEGVEAGWTAESFDLPATALGRNVKLRFEFTSDEDEDTWAGFYIDDVLVQPRP